MNLKRAAEIMMKRSQVVNSHILVTLRIRSEIIFILVLARLNVIDETMIIS